MRIRVTTRADLFEKRKQEHIERGYQIEDERPIPVNGLLVYRRARTGCFQQACRSRRCCRQRKPHSP